MYKLETSVQNPAGMKSVKANLLSTGREIVFETKGRSITLTLPKLEEYECVMLEYK